MKKKIFVFLIILVLCPLVLSGAVKKSGQSDKNSTVTITGYVISYGNIPFNYPGLQSESGYDIQFECTQKQKNKLLRLQGEKLRCTFKKEKDGTLVLKQYKILK